MVKKSIVYFYKNLFARHPIGLFNRLKKRSIFDIADNRRYQLDKLSQVLETSFANVPFYKNLNISIDTENLSYSEFQKIPILTKDVLRSSAEVLINTNFSNKSETFENSSGGSTGEPVKLYMTKEQANYGLANYYYAVHLNNVNIFETSVDLWGAERDMYKNSSKFNVREFINNKVSLNTFVLSDDIIKNYINRLNKIKPAFIKAYVHSVYDIAKYINSNGITINFIPVIHCTTGPLYPEMRAEIAKAFNGADVYSFYGSREVAAVATEVNSEDGMYVLFDNVFVEILDKDNQPVGKGEIGEVVVTTLNNHYMPLLRYKIGDRAINGEGVGFGVLYIDRVVGRTLGVIHRSDGRKIDGQFFTTMFFNKKGIKHFQLIQKDIGSLVLNIVKTEFFETKELESIIGKIKKELPGVELMVSYKEQIDLTSTGKIMYVYSELDTKK